PTCLRLAIYWRRRIVLRFHAMLHHRLNRQRARDFPMRAAAHAVRQYKQAHRRDDAEAILVISSHAADIRRTATCDSHSGSSSEWKHTPPTRSTATSFHASKCPGPRKASAAK